MTESTRKPLSFRSALVIYLALGVLFGIALTMAQVVSWYRIQEMFLFQAFHMYGIIGSAIFTAMLGLAILKRFGIHSLEGPKIVVPSKTMGTGTRYWAGGSMFGLGWGLVGACPGPLAALIGFGHTIIIVLDSPMS